MIEKLKDLTSTVEEFKLLYNANTLIIVYGNGLDDNNFDWDIIPADKCNWGIKLRGENDGNPKLANDLNNHKWFYGFIYDVYCIKDVLFSLLKHNFQFEVLEIKKYRETKQSNHFNTMFEIL